MNRSLRIVLADDNIDTCHTLSVLLEMEGHRVWATRNGQEAVGAALAHDPDVVLLDLGMPLLDGFAAARLLRSDPRFGMTYIAAMTVHSDPATIRQCALAGFSDHFVKPLCTERLLAVLRNKAAGG